MPRPLTTTRVIATALVAGAALSACATGSASAPSSSGGASAGTVSSRPLPAPAGAASPSASPSTSPTLAGAPARVPPSGLTWAASPSSPYVQVATATNGTTSFLWMDPAHLRFRFVPGYAVPEGSPSTTADRTPSTWVPRMIAGFDSGYKLSDHVGGYYYLGQTVAPLRDGLASLVVHRDGTLAVGRWGRDLSMTADTLVVRQNLRPLVDHGAAQAFSSDGVRTWGISNGNRPRANRSALGVLPDGSFLFVFAHDVTAATLADTLVSHGVVEAIDLDMNISWPTGFVYRHQGSHVVGQRINPYVVRPPSTYLARFKKDFIAVEAA